MAKPDLGSKRQCQSCAAKFFDLNKSPILCPKCSATFVAAAITRAPARAAVADDEPEIDSAGPELVSLEEADGEGKEAVVADDIEIEDDGAADETFLEEEEEEEDPDDVSALIDGDIEDDEES